MARRALADAAAAGGARPLLLAAALALLAAAAAPRAAANSNPALNFPSSPLPRTAYLVQNGRLNTFPPRDLLQYATDPDFDTLTLDTTPVTPPARGTLALKPDGGWTYQAEYRPGGASDLSPVSFIVRVLDGKGGSATGTVQITIRGWLRAARGERG
jgi:VCBS repeat-containing protein